MEQKIADSLSSIDSAPDTKPGDLKGAESSEVEVINAEPMLQQAAEKRVEVDPKWSCPFGTTQPLQDGIGTLHVQDAKGMSLLFVSDGTDPCEAIRLWCAKHLFHPEQDTPLRP